MKRRITSLALVLLLCMSLAVPAFAVESAPEVQGEVHAAAMPIPDARPNEVKTLKEMNVDFIDSHTVKVTPAKGTNLKFIGTVHDSDVTLKVYKNGGWWASTTITLKEDAAVATYNLITNCNGEEYTLIFTAQGATILGGLYQTDYV